MAAGGRNLPLGSNMDAYAPSIAGLLLLCILSLGLAVYSGMQKGKAGLVAGPVSDARDDNPLYRIDRAHMNSVEALTPLALAAVLAMLAGTAPLLLAALVWLYLLIRVAHVAVYLRGGEPARGGKLRTMLYLLSSFVTLVIVIVALWAALL
ncbi:MAG: hypothetical protein JWR75_1611 [Devosia sp.]|nr:hypothetical protein [Devosia sp.]